MKAQVTILGCLGQDPASKPAGESTVCTFSLAADGYSKGEKTTAWYRIEAWGKLGERCQQYLSKGSQAVVVGALEPREYEKDGVTRMSLDVRASEVAFVGGKPAETQTPKRDEDPPF